MFSDIYPYLFIGGWLLCCAEVKGQTVVGMGTDDPNPNAVLELVSQNQNQGFLVPRLTTAQRNAPGFTAKLTSADHGLLVFDIEEGSFYFWYAGAWRKGSGAESQKANGTVWYVGETLPEDSQGEDRDFYIHQATGDLYRKQEGVFVMIGNLKKTTNSYSAGTGINITDQNEIINTGDIDSTNELQDLTFSGTTLGLSGSNTTVDLSVLQDGTGTDSQHLSGNKTGEEVFIAIDHGNSINFSVADSDSDTTNELQSLSSVLAQGNDAEGKVISNLAAPVQAADATTKAYVDGLHAADTDQSDTNEIQDLTLSSHTLKITNNASATAIDLSPYLDNTDNQTLSLSGNELSITAGNAVDLSSYLDNTDSQTLSSSKTANDVTLSITGGNTTTFSVADNDDDDANEAITSASLVTGDILRIQEAGTDHDVDLSGFQRKALPTGQVLVGNASGVAAPVSISKDITLNSDGTMTITLDAVTTAKIINSAITTAKLADGAVTKEKINVNVAGNGLEKNADGSLEVKVTGGGIQVTTDQLQLANKGNGQVLIGDGTQVNAQTISGDLSLANTGAATVAGLQGRPISTTAPSTNDLLTWNGSAWIPQASASASNGWYAGNTMPDATTPGNAVDGNYYYHSGTQTVYRKEGGAWIELGRWAKPSGSTLQGTGITITSTRVPTIYVGTGPNGKPDETIDNALPGDLYFNAAEGGDGKLWIKKNNLQWTNF